jgi:aminoglycoside phosphotransferase (APT) family kinase protein
MSDTLPQKLEDYLRVKFGVADLNISDFSRIPGGASRETYRFRARYGTVDRGLILRRDPPASLIETERRTEYRAYEAFHRLGLPVPEPIALGIDGAMLERPFFIMEEIENCQVASVLAHDPYGTQRETIGRQFWNHLGAIARADPAALGLADFDGAKNEGDCWKHELARWERVIADDEREPQPIVHGALRWLKRHPPPPAQKISVLHGDYRSGNFLYDGEGTIRAILDWEMAHLGDPLEDLAWAMDPLWAHHDTARPAGLLARADAIALWENASGLKAEPQALFWWEVFASLKGAAIWISAAREYGETRDADPINGISGWYCLAFHNKVLADRLSARA